MYFYPWLCCWCGNLQNNHKGLNPQNGNSPLLFQLKKFHRTAIFSDKESLLKECILKAQADRDKYLQKVFEQSHNVLEVILAVFQKSIEMFHQTNKRFFEDIKKYPKVYEMMKNRQDSDSMKTMSFFKTGVEQGIFRSDVNFAIVNLLVREQFDVLLNTDICNEYPFIEVYESIMFTYIRGISTEKGARVLEDFIQEYRKNRIED